MHSRCFLRSLRHVSALTREPDGGPAEHRPTPQARGSRRDPSGGVSRRCRSRCPCRLTWSCRSCRRGPRAYPHTKAPESSRARRSLRPPDSPALGVGSSGSRTLLRRLPNRRRLRLRVAGRSLRRTSSRFRALHPARTSTRHRSTSRWDRACRFRCRSRSTSDRASMGSPRRPLRCPRRRARGVVRSLCPPQKGAP